MSSTNYPRRRYFDRAAVARDANIRRMKVAQVVFKASLYRPASWILLVFKVHNSGWTIDGSGASKMYLSSQAHPKLGSLGPNVLA